MLFLFKFFDAFLLQSFLLFQQNKSNQNKFQVAFAIYIDRYFYMEKI